MYAGREVNPRLDGSGTYVLESPEFDSEGGTLQFDLFTQSALTKMDVSTFDRNRFDSDLM